jgi:hypothetical protein
MVGLFVWNIQESKMKTYGHTNSNVEDFSNHLYFNKIVNRLKEIVIDNKQLDDNDGTILLLMKAMNEVFKLEAELKKANDELTQLRSDLDSHISKWIEDLQQGS